MGILQFFGCGTKSVRRDPDSAEVYRLSPSWLISLLLQLSKTACSACAVVLLVVVVLACRLLVVGGGLLVIVGVLVVGGGVVVVVWEGARVSVMICLP